MGRLNPLKQHSCLYSISSVHYADSSIASKQYFGLRPAFSVCYSRSPVFLKQNTKGKNASDIAGLKKIIESQILQGASISTDLNKTSQYIWKHFSALAVPLCLRIR